MYMGLSTRESPKGWLTFLPLFAAIDHIHVTDSRCGNCLIFCRGEPVGARFRLLIRIARLSKPSSRALQGPSRWPGLARGFCQAFLSRTLCWRRGVSRACNHGCAKSTHERTPQYRTWGVRGLVSPGGLSYECEIDIPRDEVLIGRRFPAWCSCPLHAT